MKKKDKEGLKIKKCNSNVFFNVLVLKATYADISVWEEKAKDLAGRFVKNFVKYTGNDAGKALVKAGPEVK